MKNNLDKIELYFFDPKVSEDSYHQNFKELTGKNDISYSPLYLLRRHTLLLSGMIENLDNVSGIKHMPYYSAIILSNITISALINIKYGDKPGFDQIRDFYSEYLGKSPIQHLSLRVLRNALEHNQYQLFTRLIKNDNQTTKNYREMQKYLLENNKCTNDEINNIDFFKVAYSLLDLPHRTIVTNPEIEKKYMDKRYFLLRIRVDPKQYINKVENAVQVFKTEVLKDNELSKKFDVSVTMDNWICVY